MRCSGYADADQTDPLPAVGRDRYSRWPPLPACLPNRPRGRTLTLKRGYLLSGLPSPILSATNMEWTRSLSASLNQGNKPS